MDLNFHLQNVKSCIFIHVQTSPQSHNSLNNHNIEYCNEVKFLGLIWDDKLTLRSHTIMVKEKCIRTFNILKSVTTQNWGGDQLMVIRIFRSIKRSILDYGAVVYGSASERNLNALDNITNEALRIASGAFKTTPVNSLYIICNEMPPDIRRNNL